MYICPPRVLWSDFLPFIFLSALRNDNSTCPPTTFPVLLASIRDTKSSRVRSEEMQKGVVLPLLALNCCRSIDVFEEAKERAAFGIVYRVEW